MAVVGTGEGMHPGPSCRDHGPSGVAFRPALTGPARDDVTTTPGLPEEPEKRGRAGTLFGLRAEGEGCPSPKKGPRPQRPGPNHSPSSSPLERPFLPRRSALSGRPSKPRPSPPPDPLALPPCSRGRNSRLELRAGACSVDRPSPLYEKESTRSRKKFPLKAYYS